MTITVSPVGGKMRPDELRNVALVVADKCQEIVDEDAPLPYTTATLLEDAVQLPGWSAAKVMQTAQLLFENGLITYPRSDSTHVAPEAADEGRKLVGLLHGSSALASRNGAQYGQAGAHEAIRPTSAARLPDELPKEYNADLRALYRLIWGRYVASFLKPARYRVTTVLFDVEN
ncbi:MAG: DNA topoisomerase [Anaerolineales bacterium]